ncbi:hypothetical protein BASA61_002871 [Batrachochytrium salamandrivorans]|nr:hypothetical protein BASA61_002871 [Batrachochytrium salamandrivorans]
MAHSSCISPVSISCLLLYTLVYIRTGSTQLAADIRQPPVAVDWPNVITTQPLTNWNRDIGTCECDISPEACDANCCCDTDCNTSDQLGYFTGCASPPSAVARQSLPFCSQYLTAINWKSKVGASVYRSSGGALCVVFVNSAVTGHFFQDPGRFVQDATFNSQFALAAYPASLTAYDQDRSYLGTQAYRLGDPIQVFFPTVASNGFMSLPIASSGSLCNDNTPAQFMVSRSESCSRVIANVSAACSAGSVFHSAYYTTGFQIAVDPSSSGTYISPTTNSITCTDAVTGLRIACASASNTPLLTSSLCSQMVTQVTYTFIYTTTPGTQVTGLLIDIVLGSYTIGVGVTIQQTYITKFATSIASAQTSKLVRSGTPGYQIGSPVLAGTSIQSGTSTAITYTPDVQFGLTLPIEVSPSRSGGSVQCPSTSDYVHRAAVTFGETSVYGCTLRIDRATLNSGCAGLRLRVYTLQTLTAAAITHVGMFGNASVNNIYDWIPVINNLPAVLTGSVPVADTTGTCSSLLTDFGIQVLYTHYGATDHPQRAIVGVRYTYTAGKFQWRCLTPQDCVDPTVYGAPAVAGGVSNSLQAFRIRSSVSFVRVSGVGTALFSPPAPRIAAQLPSDIWYPFNL